MNEKKITIASKETKIIYCFATEIAYHDITGEEMSDFMREAFTATQTGALPDGKKIAMAIIAAHIAYSQSMHQEQVINVDDILYKSSSNEIIDAFSSLITLYVEFHTPPVGEPKEEEKKGGKKKPKKS